MTDLKNITPEEAHAKLDDNAILVDVREPHEQAAERVDGAIALPLSQLANGERAGLPQDREVIFLCASGNRTSNNRAALASLTPTPGYCLTGGIMGWKRAGFQTVRG